MAMVSAGSFQSTLRMVCRRGQGIAYHPSARLANMAVACVMTDMPENLRSFANKFSEAVFLV